MTIVTIQQTKIITILIHVIMVIATGIFLHDANVEIAITTTIGITNMMTLEIQDQLIFSAEINTTMDQIQFFKTLEALVMNHVDDSIIEMDAIFTYLGQKMILTNEKVSITDKSITEILMRVQ